MRFTVRPGGDPPEIPDDRTLSEHVTTIITAGFVLTRIEELRPSSARRSITAGA